MASVNRGACSGAELKFMRATQPSFKGFSAQNLNNSSEGSKSKCRVLLLHRTKNNINSKRESTCEILISVLDTIFVYCINIKVLLQRILFTDVFLTSKSYFQACKLQYSLFCACVLLHRTWARLRTRMCATPVGRKSANVQVKY